MKKILLMVILVINICSFNLLSKPNIYLEEKSITIVNEYDASLINETMEKNEVIDDYIITIRHNNEFVEEDHNHICLDTGNLCCNTPDEELINLRNEMANFYSEENKKIIDSLNIGEENVTYSLYAPFIQIIYDDYNQYLNSDFNINAITDANLINTIYINNGIEGNDNASVRNANLVDSYDFEDALADVGIDSSAYDGDGIRIGVVESGSPKKLFGLDDEKVFVWNETSKKTEHSAVVGNIIAGESGISKNSEIYFSELGNYPANNFYNAINWQLSYPQSVHLINMSWGTISGGLYTSTSALLDYLTINSKVLFVVVLIIIEVQLIHLVQVLIPFL